MRESVKLCQTLVPEKVRGALFKDLDHLGSPGMMILLGSYESLNDWVADDLMMFLYIYTYIYYIYV